MTIFKLNHPTIKFSSTSCKMVNEVGEILEDITLEDIKLNKIERRFHVLKKMYFGGHSPLSEEFFEARSAMYAKIKLLMGPWEKHSARPFKLAEMEKLAKEQIFDEYGWVF